MSIQSPSGARRASFLWALLLGAAALVGCADDSPDKLIASAREYLDAKNDPKAAVIELKNALQKKPDDPQARFLLGRALLDTRDPIAAQVELRKAADLKHPQDEIVPLMARALLMQGDTSKVTQTYAATRLGTPRANASLRTTVAAAYSVRGELAQADRALAGAFELVPDYLPALVLQARLHAALREREAAFRVLEKASAQAPDDGDVLQLKGDLLLQLKGDVPGALEAYGKAAAWQKNRPDALSSLIGVYLSRNELPAAEQQLELLRKDQPGSPQVAYYQAVLAMRRGDLKGAREIAQRLLRVAPENANLLLLAGAVELRDDKLLQAEQLLAKALHLAPRLEGVRLLLAQTRVRARQPGQALDVLEPLLAKSPGVQVLSTAASAHLMQGDLKEAEELYRRVLELQPSDVQGRTVLAMGNLARGKDDVAFDELQLLAGADSGMTADLVLINARLARRDFDGAMKAIDALEKKEPAKALASDLRGKVLLARKDVQGARAAFEKALSVDARLFSAVQMLAKLDLADKKPEAAEQRYQKLLKLEPRHSAALVALAQLRERRGAGKDEVTGLLRRAVDAAPADAGPRVSLVSYHMGKKDFDLALSAAQNAANAVPGSPALVELLGLAQMATGDANQAAHTFGRLAPMRPQSPEPWLRQAEAYELTRDVPAAVQSIKRALGVAPDHLPSLQKAIMLELSAGRPKEALALARSLQTRHAKSPMGLVYEGDIHTVAREWPAAEASYRAALKKEPSTAIVEKLHATLNSAGKPADAEALAAEWVKSHEKDTRFLGYLANAAIARHDLAQAEQRYRAVLKLQPDNAGAMNNLAWVLWQSKKPDALANAEKANQLQPGNPTYMDTLAMILGGQGQVAKAVDVQKKAVTARPDDPMLRFRLAQLYVRAGDKAQARTELTQLSTLGDKFRFHKEVEQLMQGL